LSILILASGEGTRWTKDYPKQLAEVAGEKILLRTIRQLKQAGHTALVVAHDPRLLEVGGQTVSVTPRRFTCETLQSTQPYWGKHNIVLLGDVYWTDSAIASMLTQSREVQFFGTGLEKGKDELLGLKWPEQYSSLVADALNEVIKNVDNTKRPESQGKLWHLLAAMPTAQFNKVDDGITIDIDTPADWAVLCEKLERQGRTDGLGNT